MRWEWKLRMGWVGGERGRDRERERKREREGEIGERSSNTSNHITLPQPAMMSHKSISAQNRCQEPPHPLRAPGIDP